MYPDIQCLLSKLRLEMKTEVLAQDLYKVHITSATDYKVLQDDCD